MIPSLNKIKKRTVIMVGVILVLLSILILRTAYWQIVRGDELKTKAKLQQTGSSTVTAQRGDIYDRNGKILAESSSVNTLVCNPKDVKDSGNAEIIAQKLAPVIEMKYDKIMELLNKENRYQVIKKRISMEETEAINKLKDSEVDATVAKAFSGIYFENDSKRYYPFSVAPQILGFTGYDNNGLQGIELSFDSELSGKAGDIYSNQTASGKTLDENQAEYFQGADKGANIVLTIDETIQHFLETHLENAVLENELKEGAAGIIMNPKTGEILAMSTKPDFDANNPYDVEQFEKYAVDFRLDDDTSKSEADNAESTAKPVKSESEKQDELTAAMRNKMWRNKAIADSYEPGSTFKIITAAAALEEDVVQLDSQFYCPGFKIVADRTIKCHNTNGHGAETFVEGVQNSCNPVFMELGLRLGSKKFMEYFTAFGLTQPTDIELSGESSSIYYQNDMNEVDLACSAFGQGFQITPIQFITAVSAVVNGGNRMKPHIVKEIRNDEGVIKTYEPEVINRVISEETSNTMREILESVVASPDGTGRNAYVKGYRIGGKTGTSEKAPRGTDKRIASFIGFAPANDPEIVCLVMLDEPQVDNKYGGTIAAPLVGEIMEDVLGYLGVEKQYTENEKQDVMVEVPDLRDIDLTEAENQLEDKKFIYNVRGDGDTIVDQLPQPGTVLEEGSSIMLYTEKRTKDDDLITVPDLNGSSVSDAQEILHGRGLNFEVAGAGQSTSSGAYAVSQSVEAGDKVDPATVIGVEFRHTSSD